VTSIQGRLLIGGRLSPGRIEISGGRIRAIELAADLDQSATSRIVAPGLIDLHVHGFGGFDPLDALPSMAAALARAGTTAFQPTLFPARP
jgi:N-acetylglucosamine-6-phosphate deacetylase